MFVGEKSDFEKRDSVIPTKSRFVLSSVKTA